MRLFGLIGYPLGHSFSATYFRDKFKREGITDADYQPFALPNIEDFPKIWQQNSALLGLNVTIPHKQTVIPYLHSLDESARLVGAVNVIKQEADGTLCGYNTDYVGFLSSLKNWIPHQQPIKALVLGTGGASKAVTAALEALSIPYIRVSRYDKAQCIRYDAVDAELISTYHLIINTTPLGMHPEIEKKPPLPYAALTAQHYLYDLVYNPAETAFLQAGKKKQARIKNGLEMLYGQAEAAWEIWNRP